MTTVPCFVITRDRVSYLEQCVVSLEAQPGIELHIVDHGSTWPPMLDYLNQSPHWVHRLPGDRPPHALWTWDRLAAIVGDGRYLVTDPDIVIDAPADWLEQLGAELDRGGIVKAGLGLRLDDLPDTKMTGSVRTWEAPFRMSRRPSGAWSAPVDTTLALYPPLPTQPGFMLGPAARLDSPYLIRHLPWYSDTDPQETAHYRKHACPGSSHWINGGW